MQAGINKLHIAGRMRITFDPLVDHLPVIGAVKVLFCFSELTVGINLGQLSLESQTDVGGGEEGRCMLAGSGFSLRADIVLMCCWCTNLCMLLDIAACSPTRLGDLKSTLF